MPAPSGSGSPSSSGRTGTLTDELRDTVAALVGERVAVTLRPDRVVTWDHRKLADVRPGEIGR